MLSSHFCVNQLVSAQSSELNVTMAMKSEHFFLFSRLNTSGRILDITCKREYLAIGLLRNLTLQKKLKKYRFLREFSYRNFPRCNVYFLIRSESRDFKNQVASGLMENYAENHMRCSPRVYNYIKLF